MSAPGKHVAIDMRTDEVVLVADTPQELEAMADWFAVEGVTEW